MTSSSRPLAPRERADLADLLQEVGPDAPTCCTGWDTAHLAAHLVVRDRRADALPGYGLEQLTLGTLANARVTVNGAAVGAGQSVPLGGAATLTFAVSRQTAGQPTTVPFTVRDRCGPWTTFVGGGPGAF